MSWKFTTKYLVPFSHFASVVLSRSSQSAGSFQNSPDFWRAFVLLLIHQVVSVGNNCRILRLEPVLEILLTAFQGLTACLRSLPDAKLLLIEIWHFLMNLHGFMNLKLYWSGVKGWDPCHSVGDSCLKVVRRKTRIETWTVFEQRTARADTKRFGCRCRKSQIPSTERDLHWNLKLGWQSRSAHNTSAMTKATHGNWKAMKVGRTALHIWITWWIEVFGNHKEIRKSNSSRQK